MAYGREAAAKETDALVNRGAALLARAEADAGEDASWQSHLDAGRRQLADLNAKYEAAKNAEAEARRAYLAAHSASSASGEGAALDAMTEELARKKSALDAAARTRNSLEATADTITGLLTQLNRSGFAVEKELWPQRLTAEHLPALTEALACIEKPLEEQYFAARQASADLAKEQEALRAELNAVSGGKWVYPHGDAATKVRDAVNAELAADGIPADAIEKLQPIINLSGSNAQKLQTMREVLTGSEVGLRGVDECEYILNHLTGLKNEVELDLTLARGLNYYTGAIFEVKALDVQIGSITGGGRYDNLTGIFGMPGLSGVGISFGADRIFDVLNQLDLYPKEAVNGTRLLFVNFGEAEAEYCLPVLAKVRSAGICAEIFPDSVKMKKQMSYANQKQIPFVAIVGETEMAEGKVTLKNMQTGEQQQLTPDELVAAVAL